MFRPRAASWIDIVVPQESLATALECLSRLHAVELEADARATYTPMDLSGMRADLEVYANLSRRYRAYWPSPDRSTPLSSGAPQDVLTETIGRVRDWAAEAAAPIDLLQGAERQYADLAFIRELAIVAGPDFPLGALSRSRGRFLDVGIFLLDRAVTVDLNATAVMVQAFEGPSGLYVIAVGSNQDMADFAAMLAPAKARRLTVKDIGAEHPGDLPEAIDTRLRERAVEMEKARAEIAVLSARYRIAEARASVERLQWLADHIGDTARTALFSRITAWCATRPSQVEDALGAAGIDFALAMGRAPEGAEPPMVLENPPWARPFEVFVKLMGMPSRGEADPSPLIAVMAPLLFGFMFGDVGQGAALLFAGLVLRRRWPTADILVPGGVFAIVFGFAFGSMFAREDLIPALWLHPLASPIPVLAVALAFGVVILLTGLSLTVAQAYWRGRAGRWWRIDAGVVLAYVGVLLSFADPRALSLTLLGAVWFLVGSVGGAQAGKAAALGQAVGAVVETLLQLLINTLSFIRVGAFAIAHAGLSSAIVALADVSGGTVGFWLVMIGGNVFIVVLEGLVAGIQTTRLLLFEFFIRFLRAEGRCLRALPTPDAWSLQLEGKMT